MGGCRCEGAFEGSIWRLSPHRVCILLKATARLRFSAASTLSERNEGLCALGSYRVPPPGGSQSLPGSFPPSVLTHTLHNHHLSGTSCTQTASRVDTAGGRLLGAGNSHLCPKESSQSLAASPSSYKPAQSQSALRKATGHSSPKNRLDVPIQALSWPLSKRES